VFLIIDLKLLVDDPKLPPIPTRLALVKLFLELSLYTPALLVLHGIMSVDDQDVEAWYLEGWCFYMMAEQAQENGGTLDDLTWQELGKDARDCLETCQVVSLLSGSFQKIHYSDIYWRSFTAIKSIQTSLY